jgi:hypothetical protein
MRAKSFLLHLIFVFLLLLFSSHFAHGALIERDIEPLSIRGGARPLGMGSAYVGVSDDGNSLFYNPAGIARSKGIAVTVSDLGNFRASNVYPTGYGASLGLGFIRSSNMEVPYLGGTSESSSNILVASLGLKLGFISNIIPGWDFWKQVDVGLDVKYLLSHTLRHTGSPDASATGWDADIGIMWRAAHWAKLGVVFENFLPKSDDVGVLTWDNGEEDEVKTKTTIGLGLKVIGDTRSPIFMEGNELLLATDVILLEDKPNTLVNVGAEWTLAERYVLRAGSKQNVKAGEAYSTVTAGLGLKMGNWAFDAAYTTDYLSDLPVYHFSFVFWPKEWFFVREPVIGRPEEVTKEEIKSKGAVEEKKEKPKLVKLEGQKEEIVTEDETITIKGKVLKPGSKVYVNDNLAEVKKDGTFEVKVPVNIGKNLIEIVTEHEGEKTLVKRKVLRKAKVVVAEEAKIEEKIKKEIKPKELSIEKKEKALKPKESKIAVEEKKIKELEKKPLTAVEKKELEVEKKKIEVQKKEIRIEKEKIQKEKKALETEKKKVEKQKKEIVKKKAAISDLATLGVIDVAPDKVYEVESAITRGELASWLVKAKGIPAPKVSRAPFKDVPADHPLAPQIRAAVNYGFMKPYSDGTFRPNDPVTEAEGIEIFKGY